MTTHIFWETETELPAHTGLVLAENYIPANEGDIIGEGFDMEGRFIYKLVNGERVKLRFDTCDEKG